MSVGTPPQTFQAIVVTDSNQTLFSTFDSFKSSTAANISLGSTTLTSSFGSVTGYLFDDTISLGSYSVPQAPFRVELERETVRHPLWHHRSPGIGTHRFLGVKLASGQVAAPEIGLWLSSSGSENPGSGGSLTFGGVNPSLYSGDIDFLPLTGAQGTDAWTLKVSAFSVGGKSISVPVSSSLAGISTGLVPIAGPAAVVQTIWAAVPGSTFNATSGVYHFPCSPPVNITVSFGGKAWALSAAEITGPITSGSGECQGAIAASESDSWNFGHGFLVRKYVYTVFRAEPPAVGFAELSTLAGGTGIPNSTASPDTSIPGSPTPTGSSTIPSGGPTQSSAVPPHPEPKPATGAIVGGVIGGFVVFMLIVAFLFYRSCRRSQQRTAISPYAPSKNPQPPLSSAIDEQDKVIQTNMIPDPSLPSTTPVVRSLSTMRREQSAALSRYGDIHTAPNGMGKTSQGLQGAHPMSSELLPTDRGSEISPEAPVAGIGNPAVLEEMNNLLAEMRRLAIEEGRAPPSYS
ncbi:aspartic peptidase domain-containing protein [Mycena olivaceomarginata]|nr:aspartic peptidase domain-containing protein [Mycena olivaceomarginata]